MKENKVLLSPKCLNKYFTKFLTISKYVAVNNKNMYYLKK